MRGAKTHSKVEFQGCFLKFSKISPDFLENRDIQMDVISFLEKILSYFFCIESEILSNFQKYIIFAVFLIAFSDQISNCGPSVLDWYL